MRSVADFSGRDDASAAFLRVAKAADQAARETSEALRILRRAAEQAQQPDDKPE